MTRAVLILDPNTHLRDSLSRGLRSSGYCFASAETLEQLFEILATENLSALVFNLDQLSLQPADIKNIFQKIALKKPSPGLLLFGGDGKIQSEAQALALSYSLHLIGHVYSPEALIEKLEYEAGAPSRNGKSLSEQELMQGLVTDGLVPVFQPKMRLRDNQIIGAEMLARFRGREGSLFGAGPVILMAREKGYMDVLADRMIELAMLAEKDWLAKGLSLSLGVNIGAQNLQKNDLIDLIIGLAKSHAIQPSLFQFEISERELRLGEEQAVSALIRLQAAGFSLAIDGFGGAGGALALLEKLPLSAITLDRDFWAHRERPAQQTILKALVGLGEALDMAVIGDGIENKDQLHLARDLGFSAVQGFFIGPPMTGERFVAWVKDFKPAF